MYNIFMVDSSDRPRIGFRADIDQPSARGFLSRWLDEHYEGKKPIGFGRQPKVETLSDKFMVLAAHLHRGISALPTPSFRQVAAIGLLGAGLACAKAPEDVGKLAGTIQAEWQERAAPVMGQASAWATKFNQARKDALQADKAPAPPSDTFKPGG